MQVTSPFGKRSGDFHEGIDLKASSGTSVFAAQDGRVLYVGRKLRGYGKLVILRHEDRLTTLYAHNSRILVSKGQKVRKGQRIAISGASGHVTGPHLHFEVRKNWEAIDPTLVLLHIPQ